MLRTDHPSHFRKSGLGEIADRAADSAVLHVGLVNNMRESALLATERQFSRLLQAAAATIPVRLSLYTLPDVPRSDEELRRMGARYASIDDLWNDPPDGLIVTGAEPSAARLRDEPCWKSLSSLIDWADRNTISSIWSCLAAHAAVLHFDGIERRRLPEKLVGIFSCRRAADGEVGKRLLADIPEPLSLPHSRWNDVSRIAELAQVDRLYRVLTCSDGAGVDAFIRQGRSLFVCLQGHPEYEADTLLLEYRRDIRRFLAGQAPDYPTMPAGYFDAESIAVLEQYRYRAVSDPAPELFDEFPLSMLTLKAGHGWRSSAITFYRNWLSYLRDHKL